MNVSALSPPELRERLCNKGLALRTGPFHFRIQSTIASVAQGVGLLYADYPLVDDGAFMDFSVNLAPGRGLRRWWRPQVEFVYDGQRPFVPMPVDHAFPLLEWAMNWCISTQAHRYLILHAAVLERGGCAVIFPAPPGSGKSTLCAGLASRGWRLLSDELTLISLEDGLIAPLGRPISLKNQSLQVIRHFAPDAVLNQVTHDTAKGSVSHMKVPRSHVARLSEPARPCWVIFPQYVPQAEPQLVPRSKAGSMLELGRNAFNYTVLGLAGFDLLASVISSSDCYDFRYSQLEDAVRVFDGLAAQGLA